jgi:NADH-quinone oxidoreductase subunit G
MPNIIIDERQIEVAPGTKVIEAAAQLGIMIPRFCYHPALGSVGACRVCAVKFEQGPFKGVQMSCMIDAQDGMVVSTMDEEAVDFRRHVIEWLMLNHPHDCPVCDEGGHCLLQDMTVSGGHGIRRYAGKKRTYRDQYLGPLLQHEMNRCIHCYRCSRFYQEFSGYRDLGVMRSASSTYFGRFSDGILESPFSGNLSELCPTGVYTDKPSRYFGRRWDYVRSPSLCIHCSLGCHTVASSRYREIKRQEARFSEAVNGYFICDRGRYGFFYSSLPGRPRTARIEGSTCEFNRAQSALGEKLQAISKIAGPQAIAAACSARSSLETLAALSYLCRTNGWKSPAFFLDPRQIHNAKKVIARLEPRLRISLREVEKADFVFIVGADPINEAPMLAMALRRAHCNGAEVFVLDPRPVTLPFAFRHLPVVPGALIPYIGQLIKRSVDTDAAGALGDKAVQYLDKIPGDGNLSEAELQFAAEAIEQLQSSKRPVFICGSEIAVESTIGVMADFALLLQAADRRAGVFNLLSGANTYAGGVLCAEDFSLLHVLEEIEKGTIRALILAETDPFWRFPDRQRLERALDKLDLLVVLDYLNSRAVQKAHIFLPTATLYEAGGLYVNQEGRVQYAPPAFSGGKPIAQIGDGDHPPRIYDAGLPESDLQAACLTLVELADEDLATDEIKARQSIWKLLSDGIPEFSDVASADQIPEHGFHLGAGVNPDLRFTLDWVREKEHSPDRDDGFELLLTDWTFGTEELSSLSQCLIELEREPCLVMHTVDAQHLGFAEGDFVEITTELGSLQVMVALTQAMAPGVLCLPCNPRLPWRIFKDMKITIKREQIKKRV